MIGRMNSFTVVKHLNVFKYILLSLSPSLIVLMMPPDLFLVYEKSFLRRVE